MRVIISTNSPMEQQYPRIPQWNNSIHELLNGTIVSTKKYHRKYNILTCSHRKYSIHRLIQIISTNIPMEQQVPQEFSIRSIMSLLFSQQGQYPQAHRTILSTNFPLEQQCSHKSTTRSIISKLFLIGSIASTKFFSKAKLL